MWGLVGHQKWTSSRVTGVHVRSWGMVKGFTRGKIFCGTIGLAEMQDDRFVIVLLACYHVSILPIATDVTVVRSVCPSVTLMHPAEDGGWNEMPFGRDTHVVRVTLFHSGALVFPQEGEIVIILLVCVTRLIATWGRVQQCRGNVGEFAVPREWPPWE